MKNWTKLILGALVLIVVFIWASVVRSPNASETKNSAFVYFFDVGQGDSELIQKGNYQILIDGGPDDKVLAELGKAMPLSDRKIENLILTHPHADHLVGLNQVLERYQIERIYYNGMQYDSNGYNEFLAKIKSRNIETNTPNIGDKVEPFQNGGLTFLWPGKQYEQKTNENANNTSEVVRFCYFLHCVLFTGDIETDAQGQVLANKNLIIESELLKLAHHGSTNGTNQILLDAVKPATAVIEVGANNKFGHPTASVLDLLQKNNIAYYRTDQSGTIKFQINEAGVSKR